MDQSTLTYAQDKLTKSIMDAGMQNDAEAARVLAHKHLEKGEIVNLLDGLSLPDLEIKLNELGPGIVTNFTGILNGPNAMEAFGLEDSPVDKARNLLIEKGFTKPVAFALSEGMQHSDKKPMDHISLANSMIETHKSIFPKHELHTKKLI